MSITAIPEESLLVPFVCDCKEWVRLACAGEGLYKEHEGKNYCVLHYPGKEKAEAFDRALKKKLDAQDFDFRGVCFPGKVIFGEFQFSANADFRGASFSAGASFYRASFRADADFHGASFRADADFREASFSAGAFFREASFSAGTFFREASFSVGASFRGASFSADADFSEASFRAIASFSGASFVAGASFSGASFRADADFSRASFGADASFYRASFSAGASFSRASFGANASFRRASFSEDADFSEVSFSANANFSHATFAAYVRFAGDKTQHVFGKDSYLDLQHARVEKPDRVSFHTLRLRPHFFVNVDARKFEFVNVEWSKDLKQETEGLRPHEHSSPRRLLSIAYRQLAVNAEENHRYREAADFRYVSMDLRRHVWSRGRKKKTTLRLYESLLRNKRNYRRTLLRMRLFASAYRKGLQVLHWLYWMASGYGERVTRAVVVLAALWLVFACFYARTGFERKASVINNTQAMTSVQEDKTGKPLSFKKALTYSFGVMSLQKPEPIPLTNAAQTLVTLETVLGPIQAGLLALAIRRRFMR